MQTHSSTTPQTLDEALARIARLEADLHDALHDPIWNIASRQGIERRMLDLDPTYAIVVGDLDYLHDCNTRYGHEGVDARMRMALTLRRTDVCVGRWLRGDEFIAPVKRRNARGLARRLQRRLVAVGLSATFAVVYGINTQAVAAGIARIELAKRMNERGKIFTVEGNNQ